jgi:hypothetical protein
MTPRVWIFSHICSWMAVYVFCHNAQSESHSDPHDIYMLSLFYQLPNCNLFTSMLLFILWRDTTSELWTPVQFPLHCYTILLSLALFTFLHTIILLPLDTLNPLFTANRRDSQPYHKLRAKFMVVLCAGFTLLLGEDWWLVSTARWEPQEEGMMSTVASLPSVVKPRFNRTSRRKPNFRRWCLLASWHSGQWHQINLLTACLPLAATRNLHNTNKYFAPNLRWGCQSHWFAVNKGLSVSSGNRIIAMQESKQSE